MVSRENLRISLTFSIINYLKVIACDIQNENLTDKFREKVWNTAGPYFGSEQVKSMLVVWEL